MDKVEFPVATCPNCKVRGPVWIGTVPASMVDENETILEIEVVVCPECNSVLNSNSDLELEWFDIKDAKYFGYKVVEDE